MATTIAKSGQVSNQTVNYVFGQDLDIGSNKPLENTDNVKDNLVDGQQKAKSSAVYDNSGNYIRGEDLEYGRAGSPNEYGVDYAYRDRARSAASGTTTLGQPDWGDGYTINVTTWAADNEKTVEGGEFTYAWPSGTVSKDYDNR